MYDVIVVGGGIVGLATARALLAAAPSTRLLILEKETRLASHQTGRNSGVIHSGIYYKPGSFKAHLAAAGNRSMVEYCQARSIPYDRCGKLILATDDSEVLQLNALRERGAANGVFCEVLSRRDLNAREPHARGLSALWVPSTGVVDYKKVARALAEDIQELGGEIRLATSVSALQSIGTEVVVRTGNDEFTASHAVNCGGLQSDRLLALAARTARIIPFRGEYYTLVPSRSHLVHGLIYPVPDPRFPFLGVHLTRGIEGEIHAGPNAVLGLARESYRKFQLNGRDLVEMLGYSGFWGMVARYWKAGAAEAMRSAFKPLFVRALQRLVPEVTAADLITAPAGIRAQAVLENGSLVDDFHFVHDGRCLHVVNAPSPAATASLEIGTHIAREMMA